jgi:hypothetical protein
MPALVARAQRRAARGARSRSSDRRRRRHVHRSCARRRGHPRTPGRELGLTSRERDVLRLLADGHSNESIGRELFISPDTRADSARRGDGQTRSLHPHAGSRGGLAPLADLLAFAPDRAVKRLCFRNTSDLGAAEPTQPCSVRGRSRSLCFRNTSSPQHGHEGPDDRGIELASGAALEPRERRAGRDPSRSGSRRPQAGRDGPCRPALVARAHELCEARRRSGSSGAKDPRNGVCGPLRTGECGPGRRPASWE